MRNGYRLSILLLVGALIGVSVLYQWEHSRAQRLVRLVETGRHDDCVGWSSYASVMEDRLARAEDRADAAEEKLRAVESRLDMIERGELLPQRTRAVARELMQRGELAK